MDNKPALEVIDLRKSYSSKTARQRGTYKNFQLKYYIRNLWGSSERNIIALDGINFNVHRGEVFGLLGPNGAGKTTLIKILSTLVLPDSGRALVEGIDVVKSPRRAVKKLQTVLAESVGFERRLTGRQNLEFFADLFGVPKREAKNRIDELLAFCGLTDRADIMFQKYSTGMARRLLVCRALLSNASVILFDEPTAALDPISAADFRDLIRRDLADKKKRTILVATHNLWEAEKICDRIALLKKGKIIATGTPREIRHMVSDRVTITILIPSLINGVTQQVLEELRHVDGVTSAEASEVLPDGSPARLLIEGEKGIDYNSLFEKILSKKIEILSLEASQPTLEDAFLRLNREVDS
jgi:ABC-2 type transport system ATP-binding protein